MIYKSLGGGAPFALQRPITLVKQVKHRTFSTMLWYGGGLAE